jgi:hypothetical protein
MKGGHRYPETPWLLRLSGNECRAWITECTEQMSSEKEGKTWQAELICRKV